jgi:plastocyanin
VATLVLEEDMRKSLLVLLTGALMLAAQFAAAGPVGAVAPTLTITADRPAAVPAGHLWGYNDFFPRTIAVHRGSTIAFSIQGFHTATLAPAGVSADAVRRSLGLLTPDSDDATANPNGSTHTQINLGAAFRIPGGCGSAASPCTFNGTAVVNSGAPLAGPVPDLNVRVTAPVGVYTFLCLIHPRMQGRLAVVPDNIPATTPSQLTQRVSAQIHHDRAAGWAAERAASVPRSRSNGDGTRTWFMTAGTGSPDGYTAVNEMLPRTVDIHPGDRVVWTSRSVNEPHTVTFPMDLHGDMVALCEGAGGDVPATPTVIPPTGPGDFSCNGGPPDEIEFDGGNGVNHVTSPATVSDSGVIGSTAELDGFGLPATAASARWSVTFPTGAAKATYSYVCQIHDGMEGTIVVH